MTSTVASAIRPSLRDNRQPSSPHTPTRFISSTFSSPGSYRQEEDAVIIELTPRCLRAGFEGESGPQCTIEFNPEYARRVGDYRVWAPGYKHKDVAIENWGVEHELWQDDLKEVDLGYVEDKLERAVREVYNKYLLTDAGAARLVLVLPSVVPHPLLSSILATLFERWSYPTITLLPSPTMAAIGAGLRSALVVDIGWQETVVTSIYEYREMHVSRSVRGMKMLVQRGGKALEEFCKNQKDGQEGPLTVSFSFVEDLVGRLAFCPARKDSLATNMETREQGAEVSLQNLVEPKDEGEKDREFFDVEWPSRTTSDKVSVPRSIMSDEVENTFFSVFEQNGYPDDDERPLPELIYQVLQCLSPDVRGVCMSRVVFTGDGSAVIGLGTRLMAEVEALRRGYGWSTVHGKLVKEQRARLAVLSQDRVNPPSARQNVPLPVGKDYVEERLRREQTKNAKEITAPTGVLRQVESLGSWAGASLLASLKIKGFVEVERDKFMSHGLAGASRDAEISVIPQRLSIYGISAAKTTDSNSWTLAGWG